VQFAILGRMEVRDGAGTHTPAPGKRRALLALLLLARGRPVAVEQLADDLWDGNPPPKPRNAVQAHVSKLRKELGEEAG
jgi:DNA-binding SARP family transcriptional activator